MTAAELQAALRASGDPGTTEGRRRFWDGRLAQLAAAHRAGTGGMATARAIAAATDAIVLDAYAAAATQLDGQVHALVALGGYGRREMAPRSDVDLLFLFQRERDKRPPFISGVLHPLWDLAFDIGHSSRTIAESAKMARQDLDSCTAMLDARLLAGDGELFAAFRERLLKDLPKSATAKLRKLHEERGPHTGSVQLLEPNVKESPGGLREIHLLEWAVKTHCRVTDVDPEMPAFLADEDRQALAAARDFLWRVRHELHFAMRRRHDVLENEQKPAVARNLGYSDRAVGAGGQTRGDLPQQGRAPRVGTTDRTGADRGRELAVEAFLRDYYLHARATFHIARLGFDRLSAGPRKGRRLLLEPGVVAIDNQIELPDGEAWFRESPLRLLSIFSLSQTRHLELSEQARRAVRASLSLLDDGVRRSPEARDLFLRVLKRKQRAAAALRAMHELGVLDAYLPEFGDLTCLVQYDIYHVYTVDEHTLVGIEKLEGLSKAEPGSMLRRVYESIERKDLLFLGCLLHDIGKARRAEHISVGLLMGAQLCDRIGLRDAERRFVLFLIENHQDMVIISQRRDLDDPKLIADFAGRFASTEWLKALYVLSYGDLSAVAADAWTDWQGALLWELYHKTMEQLESGLKALEDRQQVRHLIDTHLNAMKGAWPPARVEAFEAHVQQLPARYLAAYDLARIERHLALVGRLAAEARPVAVEFVEHADRTELVICTRDQRHLLATICGVLSVNDIDILRADVQTRDDEVVLDTFQVTDVDGTPALPPWKQERVADRLAQVIGGQVEVGVLFERYSAHWSRRMERPAREPTVVFENQVSDRYTVIDVEAQDAVGLLYAITHTLGELGLDIHMAIINTVADRATDAFYVVDAEGRKLVNYDALEEIRTRLLERLTRT